MHIDGSRQGQGNFDMEKHGQDYVFDCDDACGSDGVSGGRTASASGLPQAGDPDTDWARANPARLLAFLYVSPRPCDAVETLFV